MISEKIKQIIEKFLVDIKENGLNATLVVADYRNGDADFISALALQGDEVSGQDHVLLDCLRELTVEWSNLRHKGQLVWQDS